MITARERLKLLAGSLAAALPLPADIAKSAVLPGAEPAPAPTGSDPSGAAWRELAETIGECGRYVQAHPFYSRPENRPLAYTMIVSNLLACLEMDFVFDEEFPYFFAHDNAARSGIDNPDQRYSMCKVRGGEPYRVWGHVGSATRIEFQTYAGNPFAPGGGGVPSAMMFEEVQIAPDGTFEVFLTPERTGTNWLANPPGTSQLLVRATYADWNDHLPAELHIDRIGLEGALRPLTSEEATAARIRKAASETLLYTKAWPALMPMNFSAPGHPMAPQDLPGNVMAPIRDASSQGAAKGRIMAMGTWDLQPGEALILRIWPLGSPYQGVALSDVWGNALEYANRQSCLSDKQAALSGDGTYRFIIAGSDPGYANWLDTMGLQQGQICIRIDGKRTRAFDPAKLTTLEKVKLADLAAHLPADMTRTTPAERSKIIAARRKHVQIRCHN